MIKVYTKFLILIFLRSLLYASIVTISLAFILNLLTELDFFKQIQVNTYFPIFLSILNAPNLVFEMFPFIFLISTQLFFIKLSENKEIEIFKYSGLKNSNIMYILSILSVITGIFVISIFYNISSNLKNIYLEIKSNYAKDGKYLAVITKNGLWIKDEINNKINIINAEEFIGNELRQITVTQLDNKFNFTRTILADKANISDNNWELLSAKIFEINGQNQEKEV